MGQIDDIVTFLGKVHTVATVAHYPDYGHVGDIVDATYQKILVWPPENMGANGDFITKRYKVDISETGEATLTTAINNIMIGINKFNKRAAITGWVYASYPTLCHMKIGRMGIEELEPPEDRADISIWIDVIWSTS